MIRDKNTISFLWWCLHAEKTFSKSLRWNAEPVWADVSHQPSCGQTGQESLQQTLKHLD